jgi:hypothetical protein
MVETFETLIATLSPLVEATLAWWKAREELDTPSLRIS